MSEDFSESTDVPEAMRAEAEAKIDALEHLSNMSREEVDDLPYGFVVLDEEGRILLYNRYESTLSRVPIEKVIGRNFFKEIAPCTRVEAFYGRFRALLADEERTEDRFRFRFHFKHGKEDVFVHFVKAPGSVSLPLSPSDAEARVFMTVVRRPAATPEA